VSERTTVPTTASSDSLATTKVFYNSPTKALTLSRFATECCPNV
jgi:hypothetical protein